MNRCDLGKLQAQAEIFKALSHPARLCIARRLMEGDCNAGSFETCVDLSQSGVSAHLAKLKAAGIIEGTRSGTEICYRLSNDAVRQMLLLLIEAGELP